MLHHGKHTPVKVSQSQSLLYCRFCHIFCTYIQRIEIEILSVHLRHVYLYLSAHTVVSFCSMSAESHFRVQNSPNYLRPVAGIKFEMTSFVDKIVKFLSLNICYVIYVLLWITYWLMWFQILLVFILFKFKKCPNISGIRVVCVCVYTVYIYIYIYIYIYTTPNQKKLGQYGKCK